MTEDYGKGRNIALVIGIEENTCIGFAVKGDLKAEKHKHKTDKGGHSCGINEKSAEKVHFPTVHGASVNVHSVKKNKADKGMNNKYEVIAYCYKIRAQIENQGKSQGQKKCSQPETVVYSEVCFVDDKGPYGKGNTPGRGYAYKNYGKGAEVAYHVKEERCKITTPEKGFVKQNKL